MNFTSGGSLKPELNITPLIDVVLMLLIFFMISTSFVFQPGLMIRLPSSDSSEVSASQGAQVIVTADGQIYFDRIRTSIGELEENMRRFEDKSVLMLKADSTVTHGRIVEVMDRAKRAGFDRLAIATSPLSGEREQRREIQ
ncbi:biopolymer transporter ExbD [bacterium]|nr:biopolymer transporter ExbD [candidate division CSSED10-310 bacterium]